QVAKLIAASVRDCDIAARFGGDEFCVVLMETDHDGASRLAERLRSSIANETPRASGLSVTVSIGVFTTRDQRALFPESLIEAAEGALRQAKAAGKNRVHATSSASVLTS